MYSANPNPETDVDISVEGPVNVATGVLDKLTSTSFPEAGKNIMNLTRAAGNGIPSSGRILACANEDSYPTSQEYLDIFATPVNIEIESEKVWPLQSTVYDNF